MFPGEVATPGSGGSGRAKAGNAAAMQGLSRAVRIGVAKEIKTDDYRVALTPAGARELVQKGHEVFIETGAGDGSSMSDADYERAGAQVVSVDEAWERAELLLKVKEPIEPEYKRLREDL